MFALPLFRVATALCLTVALAACGEMEGGGLAPGLTTAMNSPGAQLDRGAALDIVNQYRSTTGVGALSDDPGLDAQALSLAQQYASTGTPPKLPAGVLAIRASAGYDNFAETFSGWRNNPPDAAALADGRARRAGIASFYSANSAYGVYWVLLVAG